MLLLLIGVIVFFTLHSLPFAAPRWRERQRQRWGRFTWRLFISLGSVLAILLIAYGLKLSRLSPVVVYVSPGWLRRVTDVLMLAVFPLLYATFMPSRMRSALRYPDLVAIKLWAVAHLLVNGMLADLILFGSALAWAIVNRVSLQRRVRIVPNALPSPYNDLVAIVLGLFTYMCIVLYLHYRLIGVTPI